MPSTSALGARPLGSPDQLPQVAAEINALLPIVHCSHKLTSVPTGQMASSKCSALCSRVFSSMNGDFSRSSRDLSRKTDLKPFFLTQPFFPLSQCIDPPSVEETFFQGADVVVVNHAVAEAYAFVAAARHVGVAAWR